MARADRTADPFSYYAVRKGSPYTAERLPEPPVQPRWGTPPATMGERLMPGCECGAASRGDFQRCRCD